MTELALTDSKVYLQMALLFICQLSVLQGNLVEWMIVLSVMTLIKHLQSAHRPCSMCQCSCVGCSGQRKVGGSSAGQ